MATGSDWQGRVGREWADKADALDRLLGPVGDAGIAALEDVSGLRVLDLGCGAGATSLALAGRGAKVTGLDISDDLLARARQRDTHSSVDFVLADASIYRPNVPFEALYSRCGAMFFDSEVDAWRHLRQQLAPGAAASIVVWREAAENDWARVPLELARPVLGEEATRITPPNGPGPFAWSDPAHFQTVLAQAGWSGIEWKEVRCNAVMEAGTSETPAERAAEFAMRIGPLASRLRGIEPEIKQQLRAVLCRGFEPYQRNGEIRVGTSAWVIRLES